MNDAHEVQALPERSPLKYQSIPPRNKPDRKRQLWLLDKIIPISREYAVIADMTTVI